MKELIDNHKKAAMHLEEAAKNHHEAAKYHEDACPDKAQLATIVACAHITLAKKAQKAAVKHQASCK